MYLANLQVYLLNFLWQVYQRHTLGLDASIHVNKAMCEGSNGAKRGESFM